MLDDKLDDNVMTCDKDYAAPLVYPRTGHSASGLQPQEIGDQSFLPGARWPSPARNRWLGYELASMSESALTFTEFTRSVHALSRI